MERKYAAAKQALEQAREREAEQSVVDVLWQQNASSSSSSPDEKKCISVFDAEVALKRQDVVAKLVRSSVIAVHDIDDQCCYVRVCRSSIAQGLKSRRVARRKSHHNWREISAGLGRAITETRKESLGRGRKHGAGLEQ